MGAEYFQEAVHVLGEESERYGGLGCINKFCHYQPQTKFPFPVSIVPFDGVPFAVVLIELSAFRFLESFGLLAAFRA